MKISHSSFLSSLLFYNQRYTVYRKDPTNKHLQKEIMPLLKRKRVDPVAPPPYDPSSKESRESTVWYCPLSKEIFTDYS